MDSDPIEDMIQYIHERLIPKIGQTKSNTLKTLMTFNYTLSLEDLQAMEKEINNLFTINPQIAPTAQILYYACYFVAVIDHKPFDLTYFSFTFNIISYFKVNCPDFDIKDSVRLMLEKVVLASSSCEDIASVLEWAGKIKQIKEELNYRDLEDEEAWVLEQIKRCLLKNALCIDQKEIKLSIQEIKLAEEAGYDVSFVKRVVINNAINWIEETNDILDISKITGEPALKDEAGTREILELLKSLQIKDEELSNAINSYSNRFGVIYSASSFPALSKDRLKFEYLPLHLSTDELTQLRKKISKGVLDGSQEVSIKTYSHWKLEQLNIYQKEREILEKISEKHPTFLKYYGSYIEETSDHGRKMYEFSMVMEFCESSLFIDITRRNRGHIAYTIEEYKNIVLNLLEGFSFLEKNKIYHKDIRPEHIFLTRDGKPKIAEFSMATDLKYIQGRKDFMSPELYSAYWEFRTNPNTPKRINYKPKKSDVYSLGMVFLQMYTLAEVKGLNERDAQPQLQDYVSRFKIKWISDMLREMLNPDYTRRVSFTHMLAKLSHEFS